MKYRQLTKEQFESLHEQFARFLASQQIDVAEWKQLKEEKPTVAEEEMNIFSDLVWEDVLNRTEYIEHFSPKVLNLFKCSEKEIQRLVVEVNRDIDLTKQEGLKWLIENITDSSVSFFKGQKKYSKERNLELFDLIEKGGIVSKGELFSFFEPK